jgi:hypothetical protein
MCVEKSQDASHDMVNNPVKLNMASQDTLASDRRDTLGAPTAPIARPATKDSVLLPPSPQTSNLPKQVAEREPVQEDKRTQTTKARMTCIEIQPSSQDERGDPVKLHFNGAVDIEGCHQI